MGLMGVLVNRLYPNHWLDYIKSGEEMNLKKTLKLIDDLERMNYIDGLTLFVLTKKVRTLIERVKEAEALLRSFRSDKPAIQAYWEKWADK